MFDEHGIAIGKILFISLGSVCGSWLRIKIVSCFQTKSWGNFLVNIFASFFLGALIALNSYQTYQYLLIAVGLLGSMSTFSGFIYDLMCSLKSRKYCEFMYISTVSIFGGIFAATLGFNLVDG